MSTAQRGRQYSTSSSMHKSAEGMYRQPSYDRSFDSVRFPSNASQPSLSHSIATYTESTPSSVCRPEFGDYPHNMSQSDCGASFVSEVPASYDDTSDIDEVPVSNASKPTLIKFVEPVVQRDHGKGESRLTGMKKKKMQRIKASAGQHGGDVDVDSLPFLGFTDSRTSYASEDSHHKDAFDFPCVPPRDALITPQKEQWNVDAIDIALDDLVLDKGKVRSNDGITSPFADAPVNTISALRMRANMTNMRGGAANSVLDEAQQEERPIPAPTRSRTLSDARRVRERPPPVDAPLPPLPAMPSPSTNSQESGTASTIGKIAGLQPSQDHPLAATPTAEGHTSARNGSLVHGYTNGVSTPDSEENVFAFHPPSLSGHSNDHAGTVRTRRISRSTNTRTDSITSSNHSSLRDLHLDPREMIQRARKQAMTCGLDAEIGLDVEAESFGSDSGTAGSSHSVQAEDLPPLLSNHYLQGKVDPAEFERLNRLPERVQAAAAAAASASHGHRLSHKHLARHKKNVGAASAVQHYEPISILRAEAAFLKEDTKESDGRKKKDRLWAAGSTATASSSDLSSMGDGGHQRLKSFKSSMRLKNPK